jgi:4-amino-4-deoxy-L-arabinose transferase-like glycosyltransferase
MIKASGIVHWNRWVAIVVAAGFSLLVAATFLWGATKPVDSDSLQYLSIAQSIANGEGYRSPESAWPTAPALDRMPVWPAIIAIFLKVAPWANPHAVARLSAALCLALAGGFVTLLCLRWGIRPWLAAAGGLGLSLSPMMISMSVLALSEPSFVLLLFAGIALLFGSRRERYAAAICWGLAMLVRSNFAAVAPLLILLSLLIPMARRQMKAQWGLRTAGLFLLLLYTPLGLWLARNAMLTGRFPLISTIEGETLYGGNNELVSKELDPWGYWVLPDSIPGEEPKMELARKLGSDLALNDYYRSKAQQWIATHRADLPRLLLGKLVRAFVPMPWKPVAVTYFAFSYRLLLDLLLLGTAFLWWKNTPGLYLLCCLSMFGVLLLTTLVFYGNNRFTHVLIEILYIPLICLALEQSLRKRAQAALRPDLMV